jgi:hypothetical protein
VPLCPVSAVPDLSTLEGTMVDDSALYMVVDFKIMVSLKGQGCLSGLRGKRSSPFLYDTGRPGQVPRSS